MGKFILIPLITFLGSISLLNSQTIDSEKIEESFLQKFQKKLVDDGEAGGNVVLVHKNGKIRTLKFKKGENPPFFGLKIKINY